MAEKNFSNEANEEETIETYEFMDDNGQKQCFVVESRFKVGNDDYVALLEVDPASFDEEEECGCGHDHAEHAHAEHAHDGDCGCGHDHGAAEADDEVFTIILAKIKTDENGDVDIEVPSDEEFEKARIAYEALDA